MRSDKSFEPLESLGAAAGWLLLLTPIGNPDLPWHLSAGRRILELRAMPDSDWLSWTRSGAPWTDFEWGAQIFLHGLWSAGGVPALFALKALSFGLLLFLFLKILRTLEIPAAWRGLACAGLGTLLSLVSDLRVDHTSLVLFTAELLFLERFGSAQRGSAPVWPLLVGHLLVYALWANLHPGFVMGIAILGIYGVSLRRWELLACAAAALAGTFLTPNGFGLFHLIALVQNDMALMTAHLHEWKPSDPRMTLHRPFFLLMGLLVFALIRERFDSAQRKRPVPWHHLLAALFFGIMAFRHNRHIPYFALTALPAAALALHSGPALALWRKRAAAAGGVLLFALFSWGRLEDGLGRRLVDMRFYPEEFCSYLEDQAEELSGLKFYHPMGWGGYIGWRLYPDYRVYWDGRYLFADLIPGAAAAVKDGASWARYLKEKDLGLVALDRSNLGPVMDSKVWAILYWDDQAALLVRRDRVDPAWLKEHELDPRSL